MFRKAFSLVVFVAFIMFFGNVANAQILSGENMGTNSTSVTVGTTTYDVEFPRSTTRSAQSRLQEILYYLRLTDSPSVVESSPVVEDVPVVSSTSNIYSDIANFAFEAEEDTSRSINTIAALAETGTCQLFTGDFDLGTRGDEVRAIQKFLNRFPETRVAESGAGAPGEETNYFGSRTFGAVFAFQAKYTAEILAPLGLLNPTGYWGTATRKHANTLLGCTQ